MSSQVSSHVNLLLSVNFNFADLVQVHTNWQWQSGSSVPLHHVSKSLIIAREDTTTAAAAAPVTTRLLKIDPLFPNPYKIISAYHKMPTF